MQSPPLHEFSTGSAARSQTCILFISAELIVQQTYNREPPISVVVCAFCFIPLERGDRREVHRVNPDKDSSNYLLEA